MLAVEQKLRVIDTRSERVRELAERVRAGKYQPNLRKVAEAMLNHAETRRALGLDAERPHLRVVSSR